MKLKKTQGHIMKKELLKTTWNTKKTGKWIFFNNTKAYKSKEKIH